MEKEFSDVLKGFKMRLSWSSMSGLHPKTNILTTYSRGDGRKGKMAGCDSREGTTVNERGATSHGSAGED